MSQVRVRFAPSPTGFFHIGSARTALFNWLYARHTGGTFVLRIEDTDQARNSEEFLNVIYDSLTWLGLTWDEGPKVGGDFGPYRQSERAPIYKEYLQKLLDNGRAYEKDGAIWFKLIGARSEVYDDFRKKTVEKVAAAPTVIDDQIRGRVERVEDEDFVIFRSDGNPVFHFVNVVDDIAMKITHVIRGEDHLSNSSKHVELFKAFGAPVPAYAHIPLILKQNGPGKMSKRDQGALIEEYQKRGYLPEALVNFITLLGWSPKDDREKMPIAEIIRLFDFPGINQSNARFDDKKMAHMNMAYLLELSADDFVTRARSYFTSQANAVAAPAADGATPPASGPASSVSVSGATATATSPVAGALSASATSALAATALTANETYFRDVVLLSQPKIKGFEELPAYTAYFFTEDFAIDEKVRAKVMGKGDPKARLAELSAWAAVADFSTDTAIEEGMKALAEKNGLGFGDYQSVARLAVSGTNVGPSITGLFRVLGRERVLARLAKFAASAA